MRSWLSEAIDAQLCRTSLADLGDEHERLWHEVGAATRDGKGFRPRLLQTTYAALGGRPSPGVTQMAAAVELIHTAFLVHDDLIDGDDTRRGRLNVSGRFEADGAAAGLHQERCHTYARAGAVLVGDLALVAALRAVATCPVPADVRERLLDLVDRAMHLSAGGELADVRLSVGLGPDRLEDALAMAERKTAEYSFALPMQAAAVLAESPPATIHALGDLGRHLGLAYQLHDDLAGVFGTRAETGKSVLSDLRAGKRTALIIHACTTDAWSEIEPLVGDPELDPAGAEFVRLALVRVGSRRYVEGLVDHELEAATCIADDLHLPSALTRDLYEFLGNRENGAA